MDKTHSFRHPLRDNLADIAMGIILALVVFLAASEGHRLVRAVSLYSVPAESFFEPIQLNIPDHVVGENPVIFYDRIIHKEFTADWTVEVQKIQGDGSVLAVCTRYGHNIYQPEKGLPSTGPTIEWFLGEPCVYDAGTYRVVANWTIERPEAIGDVTTRIVSNVFQVTGNDPT